MVDAKGFKFSEARGISHLRMKEAGFSFLCEGMLKTFWDKGNNIIKII